MRIGAVFSQADSGTDPGAIRQWALDTESAGFEHLMAYDHILGASPERLGPGPFGSFPHAPYTSEHTFHEIFVLFSHLAALTTKMSFITSVLVLPQRQAAVVAKQVASIDLLSGGRIRLAVGAGWNAAEYEALGVDFADRTALLEEQIDVMRLLWTQPSSRSTVTSTTSTAWGSPRGRRGRSRSTSAAVPPTRCCAGWSARPMDGCRC
jgi:alkanesulfonate monooxygenase SsuD/methylene tetrahydromethanopterin reductase-like flavin-dependent oxidoreductase (luciferase family)